MRTHSHKTTLIQQENPIRVPDGREPVCCHKESLVLHKSGERVKDRLFCFTSAGPAFYQWRVVGFNKRPFKSWKFRTMLENADELKSKLWDKNEMQGPVFKMRDDPRITRVGRILRRFSLDELPQLYSVLKGDMSLVGPRPPLIGEVNRFESWQRRKLSLKPGLTCLWQVSGRNEIRDFNDWAKLDLEYIDNWSLWLDLKIFFKTVYVVLSGSGR